MSTVIKAGAAGPVLQRLSTVDLADHLSEARAVVAQAQRHGASLVADAEAKVEKTFAEARKAGHEAGYSDGHAEGLAAGRREAQEQAVERFDREHGDLVAALVRAITEIDDIKKDLRVAAEQDLLEFAVRIATRLTFAIGNLHRETVVENVQRALRMVQAKSDVAITVHPDDLDTMRAFAESALTRAASCDSVAIEADSSLAPGGCRVATDRTQVDATLETQVAEIVSLLLGSSGSQGDEASDAGNPQDG